jgi:hypothetical protein
MVKNLSPDDGLAGAPEAENSREIARGWAPRPGGSATVKDFSTPLARLMAQ